MAFPNPAFALKQTETKEGAGLEELEQALRDNGTAGMEQLDRRELLKLAASALSIPAIAAFTQLAQSQVFGQAPDGPQGLLKLVAAKLGPQKEISAVIWDPAELFELPNFFKKAVRAGVTTVWITGRSFAQRTPPEQQAILNAANAAGLRTLGFIDGNYDWAQKRDYVAGHYDALTAALLRLDLGRLRVSFGVDVEPYTRPAETGWNGDLTAYMDLLEQVIRPRLQAFAKQRPNRLVGNWLTRFEPFWYRNGHVTDSGATVGGLRELPNTVIAGMTYRNTAAELIAVSKDLRARAQESLREKYQMGMETLPPAEVGGPRLTFSGRERDIPGVALEVLNALPVDDQAKLDGLFFHFKSPRQADLALDQWLNAAPQPPPSKTRKAAPMGEVEFMNSELRRTNTNLSGRLKNAPPGARVVALLKTDNYYLQRQGDGLSVPVDAQGRFTVATTYSPPNRPGWLKAEAVLLVFSSAEEVARFLAAYPMETGLRAVPAREEITPAPIRVIRVARDGTPDVSLRFTDPISPPHGGWASGSDYQISMRRTAVDWSDALLAMATLAGLEEGGSPLTRRLQFERLESRQMLAAETEGVPLVGDLLNGSPVGDADEVDALPAGEGEGQALTHAGYADVGADSFRIDPEQSRRPHRVLTAETAEGGQVVVLFSLFNIPPLPVPWRFVVRVELRRPDGILSGYRVESRGVSKPGEMEAKIFSDGEPDFVVAPEIMDELRTDYFQDLFPYPVGTARPDGSVAGDTDGNGEITPADVLVVFNALNAERELTPAQKDRIDNDRDGNAGPLDILKLINYLNAQGGAEGETARSGMDEYAQVVDAVMAQAEEEASASGLTLVQGVPIPASGAPMDGYSRLVVPLADIASGTVIHVQETYDSSAAQWAPVTGAELMGELRAAAAAGGAQGVTFREEVPAASPGRETVYVVDMEAGQERNLVGADGIIINVHGGQGPQSARELGGLINAAREADNQVLHAPRLYHATDPEVRGKVFAVDSSA